MYTHLAYPFGKSIGSGQGPVKRNLGKLLGVVGLLIPGTFPDLGFEAVARRSHHDIMKEIAALGAQRTDVLVKIKELP